MGNTGKTCAFRAEINLSGLSKCLDNQDCTVQPNVITIRVLARIFGRRSGMGVTHKSGM